MLLQGYNEQEAVERYVRLYPKSTRDLKEDYWLSTKNLFEWMLQKQNKMKAKIERLYLM